MIQTLYVRQNLMQPEERKPNKPHGKKVAATETSQSIAEQTRKFLAAGGTVTEIKSGVSGQPILGGGSSAKKHITL
jgi:uncharacterized membrane protein